MKTLSVITISAPAMLLVSSAIVPLAFAASPNHPLTKIGKGAWVSFTDGFGNTCTASHVKHVHPYAFSGQLGSSP
jgi:hypothetical protein